ncbi:L-rhamnose mutarotase [Frondihabitans cladoniiphilus]|uniref:L-rhamnose mutarotase n=1 Tax=Frondihabitans cladoniiphilus TaxID=715785 RepID=A0ABP8W5V8_9MICO
MHRICFLLHVRPDRLDEYRTAHEAVWPEMLEALKATGWNDYSLFLEEETGLVVGVLDTVDFEAAQAAMAATDVDAKWQASMAPYFAETDSPVTALPRVFHLETQLAALATP